MRSMRQRCRFNVRAIRSAVQSWRKEHGGEGSLRWDCHKIESEKFYLVISSSVDCPFIRSFSAPIDSGFHPQSLFELRVSWY